MLHVRSPEEKARKQIAGTVCILLHSKTPAHQEARNYNWYRAFTCTDMVLYAMISWDP